MTDLILERFWSKVEVDTNSGCWNWMFGKDKDGYGQFKINGKQIKPHRFAYEVNKDKIPLSLQIDHLCRNRKCVNPEHMQAITLKENVLKGESLPAKNSRKLYCLRGHELKESNLVPYHLKKGERICKLCKNERTRNYQRKRRRFFSK